MMCKDTSTIISEGGRVIENQDGSVSVYTLNSSSILVPQILTKICCEYLNPNYSFNIETQTCEWSHSQNCGLNNTFNIVLNPTGNDGSIFYVGDDNNCILNIEFDYLFKVKCETLNNILSNSSQRLSEQPLSLEPIAKDDNSMLDMVNNQIELLTQQIATTQYSIICSSIVLDSNITISTTNSNFGNSGFGQLTNTSPIIVNTPSKSFSDINEIGFCITDLGLPAWANILGSVNYYKFINGDSSSYDCSDVQAIFELNKIGNNLIYPCTTPFGLKTSLMNQLAELETKRDSLSSSKTSLSSVEVKSKESLSCNKPINFFESLDIALKLDIVTTGNTLETVFTTPILSPIGNGLLYNYLINNPTSGFYVCGDSDCVPLTLDGNQVNSYSCNSILNNLLQDLYIESGLSGTTNGLNTFNTSLSNTMFASNWLHYNFSVTDIGFLNTINNKKIKLSLVIKNTCGDICVLLDNIKLNKSCTNIDTTSIFVTQSPGFELERIRDNKKSWLANTEVINRDFELYDNLGRNIIRKTNYDINDERLVINSKEIDLDISIASAIENDVWCYITDNPCLTSGTTTCNSCVDICCGDDIDFDILLTKGLSEITTIEEFEDVLTSELINVKNRQTLSEYSTIRALYDRYVNSTNFCGTNSSAFDYAKIDQFASILGNYWVDIVEQVIPSTSIWGSVKIYSNTVFDTQKFRYKSYSSLFCGNPFFGEEILSPINGISGQCSDVEVSISSLSIPNGSDFIPKPQPPVICDKICIAQMNHGSEFIGSINIVGPSVPSCITNGDSINECSLNAIINVNNSIASATLFGAATPVKYDWSNGSTGTTTQIDADGTYYVTITDANCCSITKEFTVDTMLTACWYNMQESPEYTYNVIDCGGLDGLTGITFSATSLVVNGIEYIPTTAYTITVDSSNINIISAIVNNIDDCLGNPTGITYSNYVDFLNFVFTDVGLTNYKAQLSLVSRMGPLSSSDAGFYIIRPAGDVFSLKTISAGPYGFNLDYQIDKITDWSGNAVQYYDMTCEGITVVDGEVIE